MKQKFFYFQNIRFFYNNYREIISIIDKNGGYLVAPAASALSEINRNKIYYNSLLKSNVAILDSGFFCILVRLFYKIKISKFSGYKFLKLLLNDKKIKKKKILLINPSKIDTKLNENLLKKFNFKNYKSYEAPNFNLKKNIKDEKLLKIIRKIKPNYILINIGGLKQEPLALYIKENINFKISIFCTGAAIAFLTKKQAPINDIIDKFYLGWAIRLLFNPLSTYKRFFKSFLLIKFFIEN
jgi:N-acetylglucosaminyldiphosphoundecaprenol N-acetyl-beta-D-mannosaminyltransferase